MFSSSSAFSTSLDLYHAQTWPSLSYVAEDNGRIVGYILAKMFVRPLDILGVNVTEM